MWFIRGSYLPQTSGWCTVERRTVFQQIPIKMKTNIGLQTFWKPLKYTVHVNTISVCPRVLKSHNNNFSDAKYVFTEQSIINYITWKYSSSLCLNGFGIWWNLINSRTLSIWVWYLAVPEYNLWIIADTLPNILAYIRAIIHFWLVK